MRFRVDVSGKKVAREIGSHIEDGIDNAAGDISRGIERRAKGHIRRKGAVFRHELIEGFEDATLRFGDRTTVSVRNVSGHAPAHEYGVSGTEVTRETPLSYKNKKPPVTALIPWVRAHLVGTGFDPGYSPQGGSGDGSSGSDSGGTGGGDGGSDVDDGNVVGKDGHNPLMGADELTAGTTGVFGTDWNGRTFAGEITHVYNDYEMDYRLDVDGADGTIDIKAQWIDNYDGRGADPDEVAVGETVYVGRTNSYAVIVEVVEDPEFGTKSVRLDFQKGSGPTDGLFDTNEVEIVDGDPLGLQDGSILTDENGLYVPGTNFREFDISTDFDVTRTFPGQSLVIYDTFDKKYRRATLDSYPDDKDKKIRVQFEDDGAFTEVRTNNQDGFKLAGGRFWDSLPTDEKKDRLREHFDKNVRSGHKKHQANSALDTPSKDRLDWVRDKWLDVLWDNYQDDWHVKESFRNYDAQFDIPSGSNPKVLGGIAPVSDSTRYISRFWSKAEVSNQSLYDEEYYLGTLRHETLHAFTTSLGFKTVMSKSIGWEELLDKADWSRSGLNMVSGPDLPSHITEGMFKDFKNAVNPDPVGGTDWIKDAHDAAEKGSSGIQAYTPDLSTPENQQVSRLLEAGNVAYWMQTIAAQSHKDSGNFNKESEIFVLWGYSSFNAEETLATLHELLTSSRFSNQDRDERLRYLKKHYPWLVDAWLNVFTPGTNQKRILDELGFDV